MQLNRSTDYAIQMLVASGQGGKDRIHLEAGSSHGGYPIVICSRSARS